MRRYIRHPSDVPIEVRMEHVVSSQTDYLRDISLGGLCFKSVEEIDRGTIIIIRIPLARPIFEAKGRVVWCRRSVEGFDVGVEFTRRSDVFRARLVEQVCYIEHYRNEIRRTEGRDLSGEEAALEWIQRFAKDFPHMGDEVAS